MSRQTALFVRAGQVISLVEVAGGVGSRTDIPNLAGEMGVDLAVLLPTLEAAEMLGLVRVEDGDLFLTEEGLRFLETSKDKVKMLKDKLAGIEPFRTAIELSSGRGGVTSRDVADSLAKRGIEWHYKTELNESLVHILLIYWTIPARLLSYNGKSGRFRRV
jgi:NitT/TauT family transport system ATP-binding protein